MLKRDVVDKTIGKGFADQLDEVIMENFGYTRREMVEGIGCANFIAAAKLSKVLTKLGVATPAQLYKVDPSSLARTRGIGAACIFVAMCVLDSNGHDPIKWWSYNDNLVKFSAFKHHAMRRAKKRKQEVA